jgi:hypothetical protein
MSRAEIVPEGTTTITASRVVDAATAKVLWDLYVDAFAPLQECAAARQLLTVDEFARQVLDARVKKYLAWGPSGEVVGLATVSPELATVPWISPAFYRRRYPEHFDRQAIFYCGLAMVHPGARQTPAFAMLVAAFARDIAAVNGILAADMCRYNIELIELARVVTRILRRQWGGSRLVELDRQVYLAWEPPSLDSVFQV